MIFMSDIMPLKSVQKWACVCIRHIYLPDCREEELEAESDEEEEEEEDYAVMAPTPKRRKLASQIGLDASLKSGLYPEFLGVEGPVESHDPDRNNALDYLLLLWPESLTSLIAAETNKYACQNKRRNWVDVSTEEIWTFLGITILMGVHRLPRIRNYWSTNSLLGVPAVRQAMSLNRFWAIWSNLHLVDNSTVDGKPCASSKIEPLITCLSDTFLKQYNPGQELSVDESMVKYKGHCRGKVRMPKKPIKLGFKIWCCSCACCGYLCTFQVYDGKPHDPVTGKSVCEKGLVKRVVTDLVAPFADNNHVVYCDNFFTSGPLADILLEKRIFLTGTIKRTAEGFPVSLKSVVPPKGSYVSESVGGKQYFVFNDRKIVSFLSNVFPESMDSKVFRLQHDGFMREQSVPPLLPAYNKFMCAVDVTDQLKKTYGYDRKSKRPWIRLFHAGFDFAINNAHILYKHNCKRCKVRSKDQLDFRLELVEMLLKKASSRCRKAGGSGTYSKGKAQSESVCYLKKVGELGLKRGRCHHCLKTKKKRPRDTSFGCSVCRVRLCKTTCFQEYHNY